MSQNQYRVISGLSTRPAVQYRTRVYYTAFRRPVESRVVLCEKLLKGASAASLPADAPDGHHVGIFNAALNLSI
jgi:hypothetical protein